MPGTISSLAEEAGVTPAVISRFLRGDPTLRISRERRERISEVRERLGGVTVRRRRNRRDTRTILMPINRVFSAEDIRRTVINSQACRAMEEALKANGYRLHTTFFDLDEQTAFFEATVRTGQACDGLVLLSGIANAGLADLLRAYDFPHVGWSSDGESLRVNTVRPDTAGGYRQAVKHLCELGHKRIGFLGSRQSVRYPLLVGALVAASLPLDDAFNCWLDVEPAPGSLGPDGWRHVACRAAEQWLGGGMPATTLICANDEMALGVMDALRGKGLRPGEDLSIVGHDNVESRGIPPIEHPVLTTIDHPTDQIGRRAAELLLNQIVHRQIEIVHERLPAPLIVRETTGMCPDVATHTAHPISRASPERSLV